MKDITINGVVCRWDKERDAWMVPTAIWCSQCSVNEWANAGWPVSLHGLELYMEFISPILIKITEDEYLAFCPSNACRKKAEISLICPTI